MWMGNLVRATSTDEKTGKDWLFFLLSGFGLSIAALAIAASISEYAISLSVPVLLPITFGFALSLGFHLVRGKHTGKTKTALTWFGWNQNGKTYLLLFAIEVILLGVSIRVADTNHMADTTPHWLGSMLSTTSYIIVPWLGIVMAALLIRRVFSSEQPPTWHSTIPALLMVTTLFLMIGYQALLISMWDVATDGLGWVFLWLTSSTIGIGSAIFIAWIMPRKRIWIAILFALIVPSVLLVARNLGTYDRDHKWGTTPIITTERRADRIDKAIQRYYEKNNRYPQALSDLTPRYLLYIPNPYIIPGQDWCYEGEADYYQFGYVYRQYFSTPASVRIHSSAGKPFTSNWGCEDEAEPYAKPLGF